MLISYAKTVYFNTICIAAYIEPFDYFFEENVLLGMAEKNDCTLCEGFGAIRLKCLKGEGAQMSILNTSMNVCQVENFRKPINFWYRFQFPRYCPPQKRMLILKKEVV